MHDHLNIEFDSLYNMLPIECCCVICTDSFDTKSHRPLVLPCGHTIGKGCLNNIQKCPNCTKKFDPRLVPVNYTLENFITYMNQNIKKENVFEEKVNVLEIEKPDICEECALLEANSYCMQCDVMFCGFCWSRMHARALANHSKIDAIKKPERSSEYCKEHRDEKVKFFCLDCSKQICRECAESTHGNHEMMNAQEAAMELEKDFSEQIISLFEVYKRNVNMITGVSEIAKISFEQIENEISKRKNAVETLESISNTEKKMFDRFAFQFEENLTTLKQLKLSPIEYFASLERIKFNLKEKFDHLDLVQNNIQQLLIFLNANFPNN